MMRSTMSAAHTHGVAPSILDGLQRVTLSEIAKRVNDGDPKGPSPLCLHHTPGASQRGHHGLHRGLCR